MDTQLELKLYNEEIDLDNYVDGRGIRYIGKAIKQNDGKYFCLADVSGMLCRVEVVIKRKKSVSFRQFFLFCMKLKLFTFNRDKYPTQEMREAAYQSVNKLRLRNKLNT